MEKVEYKVAVHKSAVPLMNGESVQSFTSALMVAGTDKLKLALNLTNKSDCYMSEIFGSTAVFGVYKYDGAGERQKYYAVSYSRDAKSGVFSFGETVEVQRKTVYEKVSPVTKEVWSTSRINDLPDAAFAIIKPGGKKDKDGKTVPRDLRMLPHHNENVKSSTENTSVDVGHLQASLARVEQSGTKLSDSQRSSARKHLQAHAKELLPTYQKKPTKKSELPDLVPGWQVMSKDFWRGVVTF